MTNDEIFNEIIASNISVIQTERICNELLSKGVLISDSTTQSSNVEKLNYEYDKSQIDYNELYNKIIKKEPNLAFLVNYIKKIQPPQQHEVERLLPQIKSGNQYARKRLFEMNMRAVLRHAYQKSKEYHLSLEDTIQNAMIGLNIAIDRFDFSKHEKFQGYSVFPIMNSINRNKNIEETLWTFPAHFLEYQEKIYKYLRQTHKEILNDEYHVTENLISEISNFFGISKEMTEHNLKYLLPILNLDNINLEEETSLIDFTDYSDNIFFEELNNKINTLKERERQVIKFRFGLYRETDSDFKNVVKLVNEKIYRNDGCYNYGLSLTLEEVASLYGLTRERVRQIEAKALKSLRIFCS